MGERLIYCVTDDLGLLYTIVSSLAEAEKVIAEFGNEFWSIDSEVMC